MPSNLGFNPWVSIWTKPRKTIRSIIEINPKYHFLFLATIYAWQTILYYATYFSLGLSYHVAFIIILSLVVAPIIGSIMLYVNSWILHFTGRWLKGGAPFLHVRAALSWSKVPLIINIFMWFILLVFSSDYIFIQYSTGPTPIFINIVTLIAAVWSLVILIQNVKEVQNFTIWRSISNIVLHYVVFYILLYAASWIFTFFYVLINKGGS